MEVGVERIEEIEVLTLPLADALAALRNPPLG
jgi:hypothetical protein